MTTATCTTYGTYKHIPKAESPIGHGYWLVTAEPHVMVRLKRHFPRVRQDRGGGLALSDTDDVARDLQWFCERFPLAPFDLSSELHLVDRAAAHRQTQERVVRILAGERSPHGWREPAIPPRDYQRVVPELVRATGRLLLCDDLGTGKTLSSGLILCDPAALPAVVVTETHLARQWERELRKFLPWLTTHIAKTGQAYNPTSLTTGRGRKRRPLYNRQPDVIILTYSKLAGWADHLRASTRTVIFDEMQALRHSGTNRYIAAGLLGDAAIYRIGATASPVYNYGDEIYNVVSVLDSTVLGTWDEFTREWCTYVNGHYRVTDPAALGTYLRDQGIMLRRTAADVGRELPPMTPIEQNVDVDPAELDKVANDVAAMARLLLDKAGDRTTRWRAASELDWKLRRATGLAKAKFVAGFVKMLLETEDKVLLFGWHRDVYDVWMEALAEFNPVMYTGTESPTQKTAAEDAFKDGDARVLIMSLRSGAGVDGLQAAARVVVFGELDWSPQVHRQAIGRLHRDGQDKPVLAYYLVSDEGADPPIADVLDVKTQQSEPMLNPDQELFQLDAGVDMGRTELLAREVLRRRGVAVAR